MCYPCSPFAAARGPKRRLTRTRAPNSQAADPDDLSPPFDHTFYKIAMSEPLPDPCFAIISDLSLQKQCALDIFSGFLEAVAEKTKRVGGVTESIGGGYWNTKFKNSTFVAMSDILVESGLVVSEAEANAIVIPPFACRGLLPTVNKNAKTKKLSEKGNTEGEPKSGEP